MTRGPAACCLASVLVMLCGAPPAGAMTGASGSGAPRPEAAPDQTRAQSSTESDAQNRSAWELELNGGLSWSPERANGTGTLPSTGTVAQGLDSISTFFLGTGAQLFNDAQSALGASLASHVQPLDSVLLAPAVQRPAAGTLGVRVSRAVNGRFAVEFAGSYDIAVLAFRPAALQGVERTRRSYGPALTQLLSTGGLPASADATVSIIDRQPASQLILTGALVTQLRRSGRLLPYVTGGAGLVLSSASTSPTATLAGSYEIGNPTRLLGRHDQALVHGGRSRARVRRWCRRQVGRRAAVGASWRRPRVLLQELDDQQRRHHTGSRTLVNG